MKNLMFILLATFMSVGAFAKVTVFTNDNATVHVLQSEELAKLKADKLSGLQLFGLSVKQTGQGIGTTYDLTLQYSHVGIGFKSCSVNARVVNQKVKNSPPGVTASELSSPKFSEVRCAM